MFAQVISQVCLHPNRVQQLTLSFFRGYEYKAHKHSRFIESRSLIGFLLPQFNIEVGQYLENEPELLGVFVTLGFNILAPGLAVALVRLGLII